MSQFPHTDPLRRLISEQEKTQRMRLISASVCAMLVSSAAVILLGLSAWFLTASAIAGLAGPLVAKAFNYMIPSAMIRMLAIVRTAGRYGERVTGHDAALQALARIRPSIFRNIARSTPARLDLSSGEASARLMQDVDAIQNRFVRLSAPWGAGMGILTGIILCGFAGGAAAASIGLIAGLYVLASHTLAQRVTRKHGAELRHHAGHFKAELSSLMSAAPELRAYGMTGLAITRVEKASAPYEEAARKLAIGNGWLVVVQTVAMTLAVVAVVLTTASGTPALMALALLGSIAVMDACGTLVTAMGQNGSVEAAIQRLSPLMTATQTVKNAPPLQSRIDVGGLFSLRTRGRIAITGASGSGKTTLVEQLMRLRAIPEGIAQIDGRDLARIQPLQARDLFAYAPQQAHFLNGTIAENLRLAAPDATDHDLWSALEDACLAQRIRRSPEGLAMQIGENGHWLSGGERRRLGLARAYLRHAPFLILDEPTEGLDRHTETQIVDRLDRRLSLSGQGLILISHRPFPMRLCQDRAVVQGVKADGSVRLALIGNLLPPSKTCVV